MKCTVFYSWQSDLPGGVNRHFIQEALELAVKRIIADGSVNIEPRIDRDTAGVAGAPDIVQTILSKIEQAEICVCDVSIINSGNKGDSRPTPNPNVLVEMGYAMGKHGLARIIMVMNTAFGEPNQLPFDLRTKRQMQYRLVPGQERAQVRNHLARQFEEALRIIFANMQEAPAQIVQPTPTERAISAIEASASNQAVVVRRFTEWVTQELVAHAPDWSQEGERDDLLVNAIERTVPIVIEYGVVARSVAEHNATDAAVTLYKGLESILQRYNPSEGFSGQFFTTDFDYFKFVAHELLLSLFAMLIQERRWNIVGELLDEPLCVNNLYKGRIEPLYFDDVYQSLRLLEHRNERLKLNKLSLHATILEQRHTQTDLAKVIPMQQLMDADYFLFLRGEFQKKDEDSFLVWHPITSVYLRNAPRYLVEAVRLRFAEQLMQVLKVKDIETLRLYLRERAPRLSRLFRTPTAGMFIHQVDIDAIGSR
jgi:hypothetical protein